MTQLAREVAPTLDPSMKVNFETDFELVAMRWRYFLKSPNPLPERMKSFEGVLRRQANRAWSQFRYAYSTLGYDQDDVMSLARVYLVSYLGVFSVAEHPERMGKFAEQFEKNNGRKPSAEDVLRKDRSNLSDFLWQRLEEAAKVCSQKNRNIRGTDRVVAAMSGRSPTKASDQELLSNPSGHGYKKITMAERDRLARDASADESGAKALLQLREFEAPGGVFVRLIDVAPRDLTASDLDGAGMYPGSGSSFVVRPWDMDQLREREEFELFAEEFFKDPSQAARMLREYVARNEGKPGSEAMLAAARKMLRSSKALEKARETLFPSAPEGDVG